MELPTDSLSERLVRLATLTRTYSRYSRSAGGLGTLLGGVFCLLSYFGGALLPLTPFLRVILALLPLVWIAAKESLRLGLYQAQGGVREELDRSQQRWHLGLTVFLAIGSVLIIGCVLFYRHAALPYVAWIYLAYVVALPVLTWYFLWSIPECAVGGFLLCQAAVAAAGLTYPLIGFQLWAPVMAVFAILVGWREHRAFRTLRRELEACRVDA
jgi:hypothetical protein